MNENIDLTKILEGCEGIELYTSIYGKVNLVTTNSKISDFPIEVITKDGITAFFNKDARYSNNTDSECTIFPSKEQRDWSKFVGPMKEKITAWVVRDADGRLNVFRERPRKADLYWYDYNQPLAITKDNFPSVKWEDKEPMEVEITIKEK